MCKNTRNIYGWWITWCTDHCWYMSACIKYLIQDAPNSKIHMTLVSSCSCPIVCPIHWNQVISREWRCSWSSADRRSSNYICVINLLPTKARLILYIWWYLKLDDAACTLLVSFHLPFQVLFQVLPIFVPKCLINKKSTNLQVGHGLTKAKISITATTHERRIVSNYPQVHHSLNTLFGMTTTTKKTKALICFEITPVVYFANTRTTKLIVPKTAILENQRSKST